MKNSSWALLLLAFIGFAFDLGCGGEAPAATPDDTLQVDTVPLDGRGGGVLAYTLQPGPDGGVHQIHVMNADGSGSRQLIEAAIGLNHHDWSPDAQRLAAVGYYGDTWSVHTFDADGTNLRRLTTVPDVWDTEPTWSPDGSRIAFTRTYVNEDYRSEVWLMNADGTGQHYIGVEGFAARWSPDGSRLIFQSSVELAASDSDIMTCRVDGSDVIRLTQTPEREVAPVWSPDGSEIAFSANYDGDFDLYIMDSDGTNVRRITDNDVGDYTPRWSPDGTRLAFDSDPLGNGHSWEVYIVRADGTGLTRVTETTPPRTSINPVWRPVATSSSVNERRAP